MNDLGAERLTEASFRESFRDATWAHVEFQRKIWAISDKIADDIVANGGITTDRDVWLLAMHGFIRDAPEGPKTKVVEIYDRMEATFGAGAWDQPVAELTRPEGNNIERMARVPPNPHFWAMSDPPSPLRFQVYREGSGIAGRVLLPVVDMHWWKYDGLELTTEDSLALAHVHRDLLVGDITDYTTKYRVGYADIYAIRTLGGLDSRELDSEFLEKIALAREHFEEPAPQPVTAD